jgi:hypothetical protein
MALVATAVRRNSHIWNRHHTDWYVEPQWCSSRLFETLHFSGQVHEQRQAWAV